MSRKQPNFNVRRHYGFEDRAAQSEQNIRKVSFKGNFKRIVKFNNNWKQNLERRLKDLHGDDVDMSGTSSGDGGRQFRKFNQFRGNNRGRGGDGNFRRQRGSQLQPSDWYSVRIGYGKKYSKEYLLKLLLTAMSPDVFIPISYSVEGNDAIFYVDDLKIAQALSGLSMKISLNDGHKMNLRVREARPPPTPMNSELKERIKTVMASRYIANNKALDLSKFVKDPALDGSYCALSRPNVLSAVCNIISENIPDIVAINLTGNRIFSLDEAAPELRKLKELKILHLGENNLKSLNTLNCLRDTNIMELVLDKNPVCSYFTNKAQFVSEVRKRFPKLTKLDNVELPPVISFDIGGEETKLPTPQAAFISNPEGRGFVKEFLSQYFLIYDSDNRLELAQAYHDEALFSHCTSYPPNQSQTVNAKLQEYMVGSRNLLKVVDYRARKDKLHKGKANIVTWLQALPKTQHDLMSFAVDLPLYTPLLISLCVSGVFRERDVGLEDSWPVRYFSRQFLIVPAGQGFCVINELLYVTNATLAQKAAAFQSGTAKPVVLQSPPGGVPVAAASAAVGPDEAVKLQMVQTLSSQTGMNMEWSKKCLDETQWDFNRAVYTFTELHKQGTIPPEAFVK